MRSVFLKLFCAAVALTVIFNAAGSLPEPGSGPADDSVVQAEEGSGRVSPLNDDDPVYIDTD